MDEIRVFVNHNDIAAIICPSCGERKSAPVGKFKSTKHAIKVKCTCGHSFTVRLDFRKHYRKPADLEGFYAKKDVDLTGYYVNLSQGEDWDDAVLQRRSVNCRIVNISQGGIGLKPIGLHAIKEKDELRVRFFLDDKKKSMVDRNVLVVLVENNHIGCQFTEPVDHDKVLGFYLLP